jgi:molybdopterin molybdotransferase
MRAILSKDDQGRVVATPVRVQDSSMMQALARADGFVIRQPHEPAGRTGDPCRVLLFGL